MRVLMFCSTSGAVLGYIFFPELSIQICICLPKALICIGAHWALELTGGLLVWFPMHIVAA
jgi:hypothetical protein